MNQPSRTLRVVRVLAICLMAPLLAVPIACEFTNEDPTRKLELSLIHGNATADSVKSLLAEGADPQFQDGSGFNLLCIAANPFKMNLDKPEENISRDQWVDQVPPIFELLIKAGTKVNQKADDGQTALFLSATCPPGGCDSDGIKTLIAAGAEVNLVDQHGNTPLALSVESGCPECAMVLLNAGAKIDMPASKGLDILRMAKDNQEFEGTPALAAIESAAKTEKP